MNKVGFVGWRGMVGSVLMQRMQEENDFRDITPFFFTTSQVGQAGPVIGGKASSALLDANSIETLKEMDIISEGKVRQMGYNAMGVKVDVEDAHLIGAKIRDELLPKLEPDKRMYSDGTITEAPDDMTLFKDEDEQWKNYSVNHGWLKDFSEFCLQSKGFQVF